MPAPLGLLAGSVSKVGRRVKSFCGLVSSPEVEMRFTPDERGNGVDGCYATELAELLTRLADEIGVLRQAVDELREELAFELRKLRDGVAQSPPPFHLTSIPRDPCAEDFHQRVNAIEVTDFDPRLETLESFVERLTADAAVGQLAADAWYEDQEFPPGKVIEVELAIHEWFAEYPVTVKQGADWFLVDDGLGNFFLLWRRSDK